MRKYIQTPLLLAMIIHFSAIYAAPRGLDIPIIKGTAKGPNQINLTWSGASNPGYGYCVEIQSDFDSRYLTWTELRRVPYWVTESHYVDPIDDTPCQYPVFTLKNNTKYDFRVRTYSGNSKRSSYSNVASCTTLNYKVRHVSKFRTPDIGHRFYVTWLCSLTS